MLRGDAGPPRPEIDSSGRPDDSAREALHLFELWAELQQQQVHARSLEGCDTLPDLLGRSD
jgi:hypothetical protein